MLPRAARLPFPVAPTVLGLLFAIACDDQPLPTGIPTARSPLYTIADASHDYKPGFYWLPPMAKQPAYTGTFDAALSPTVEICELLDDVCGPVVATYTTTTGPGEELVRLHVDGENYHVNWHTNEFDLSTTNLYRVSVRAGIYHTLLGYADVQPVSNGSGLKNVNTDEYIGLVDGRTLPIKFRIETGIVGNVEVQPVEATAEPDATQQFVAILRDLHGNLMSAHVSWASSDEAVATMDQTGLATAIADGVATITATSERISGSATLTVVGGVVMVSVGNWHSCALDGEGRAYCWGRGSLGQLGNGSTLNQFTPVAVTGELAFTAIEAGFAHTCGVTTANEAYCWGSNTVGQIGDGSNANSVCELGQPCRLTPAAVSGDLSFASISAGLFHTCGITSENRAYCWGEGGQGRLGNGAHGVIPHPGRWPTPQAVSGGLSFVSISAGSSHTCAVDTDGRGYCWGFGSSGQLGDGSTAIRVTPVLVAGELTFASIQAGTNHTCGVTIAGEAYCWGAGAFGRLGNGSTANQSMPVAVSSSWVFASISAGVFHNCGVTTANEAYCWGQGTNGKLGDGTTTSRFTPVPVSGDLKFSSITAGGGTTCGVTTAGQAYCWGEGLFGQVGNGLRPFAQTTPVLVASLP